MHDIHRLDYDIKGLHNNIFNPTEKGVEIWEILWMIAI